jgi:NAD(P)-dependent dehydrogenase (short-subunit alcohol dehydrogenase family)
MTGRPASEVLDCVVIGAGAAGLAAAAALHEAAVDTFTRALPIEVAGQGVRVCAVRPGLTLTEIFESTLGQEGASELARRAVPMGRIGQPEEVAAMVLWLCSPEASYATGFTYDVSGGR